MLNSLVAIVFAAAACCAAAALEGDSEDSPRSPAEFAAAAERLRSTVADIAGLTPLSDGGELAGSLVSRFGLGFAHCDSPADMVAQVEAGRIAYLDIEFFTLSCTSIGDGTYFCSGTEAGEWVASNLDVAREWLSRAVALSDMLESTVLSG